MAMVNLEPICARYGRMLIDKTEKKEIKKQETTLTKALGVLVESGVYSMAVFLLSCQEKEYGSRVLNRYLRKLWQESDIGLIPNDVQESSNSMLTAVRKITEDLSKLILARRLTEQTLIFARYHAKAESLQTRTDWEDENGFLACLSD